MRRPARSDQFAAALDGRGGFAVPTDESLTPLVALARQLQELPLGPTPEFRDALRQRLVAVASVTTAPSPVASPVDRVRDWASGWRVQRGLSAAAACMATVVAVGGISVAGSRSLPGDPFYGVKQSAEGLQVRLARNDINRGKRHLQHAETRLHEIEQLVGVPSFALFEPAARTPLALGLGGSTSDRVRNALRDMDEATRSGSGLLTQAYLEDKATGPLQALTSFTIRQRVGLKNLLPAVPSDVRGQTIDSLALVDDVAQRANSLLVNGVCGEACQPKPAPPLAPPTAVPAPQVNPSPTSEPAPCTCPTPEPQPTAEPAPQPEPAPTKTPEPAPSPSETPEPTPSPTYLPVPLPEPIGSTVEDIIRDVEKQLPVPLPTLPPAPAAPDVPALAPVPPALPAEQF